MEFSLFISQDWKVITGLEKLYQGLENYIMGLKKLFGLQHPGRPGVKIQSNGVLAESYKNFGGDYGKRA